MTVKTMPEDADQSAMQAGIRDGFIDIHCHILPNMDDGPMDSAESAAMMSLARTDGTAGIVATPHVLTGVYDNTRRMIGQAVAELRRQDRDIQIYAGAEVRLSFDIAERIDTQELPLINDKNFLLLELPPFLLPPLAALVRLIGSLKERNIHPIFSHPERSLPLRNDPSVMQKLISCGALFQITAMSLSKGGEVRKSALSMIRKGHVHVVASDAHDLLERPPLLSLAFRMVMDDFGESVAQRLFRDNPLKVIRGEAIL